MYKLDRNITRTSIVILSTIVYMVALLSVLTVEAYAQANRVNIRAGVHDRFERLVFDWRERVQYTSTTEGDSVTIQFNKPATLNTSSVDNGNLKLIRNFKYTNNNNGLYVSFDKADKTRIQAFWAGARVAFDIQKLTQSEPSFSQPLQEDAEKETQTGPQKPQKIDLSQLNLKQTVERIRQEQKETKVQAVKKQYSSSAPSDLFDDSENTIRFPLTKETTAAVFQRNDVLWVAFGDELTSLPPQLKGERLSKLPQPQRITQNNATAFRFDMSDVNIKYVYLERDNFDWIVNLSTEPRSRGTFLDFRVDFVTTPKNPKIISELYQEKADILSFTDPQVGDRLNVIALNEPTYFVSRELRYPEFTIIPTIHGIVMEAYSGDVLMAVNNTMLEISGDQDPLLLSNNIDRLSVLSRINNYRSLKPRLFQIEKDLSESLGNFSKARRRIEKNIDQLQGIDKASGYLELAKHYISYGFGLEANGILDIAYEILPDLKQNPEFIALRGVAYALSHKYELAIDHLTSFDLTRQEEAQLWLGYVYSQMKLWKRSQAAFSRSGDTLDSYPAILRSRIMLAQAEADVKEGQITSAMNILEDVRLDNDYLPLAQKSAFMYLRANVLMQTGNENKAQEILTTVANGRDRLYRAKAEFDLVRRQYDKEKIDINEAVERLEKQRFAWRGDRLEILIIEQLAQYYFIDKKHYEGFSLLRDATSLSDNSEDRERITETMAQEFEKLFVEGEASELTPLNALSVYNGFKELTPVADKGTVALRYLAKRLKGVDLLGQSEQILAELITYRTDGALKAEIGAELAAIQLINKKPSNAIQTILKTKPESSEEISDELIQQRKLLLAKGYADNSQIDKAGDILRWDASLEAMQLKADINWNAGQWEETARLIDRLIRRATVDGIQEDEKSELAGLIVRQGIAFALEGDQFQLDRLKENYGEMMADREEAKIFNLITQPITSGSLADLQSLQNRLNNVDLFSRYLENFNPDNQ